ncbi:unnamed protein product [Caenorhabditis sp. 36 PRJEB53466]|nr:unnamed protein product [Caenorhabditis sp. 36 PRJEB53466]
MGKGYNDKVSMSAEKVDDKPRSREYPSVRIDKTQGDEVPTTEEKRDEKTENCVAWSRNLLKTARISKITQEYRENKEFRPNVSSAVSEKMTDKNRYRHIFCADENRVVLKERDSSNDYIHASWMEMPDQVQFISTQGPIKNTIADFWHMIFTEKCPVIVMLCQYVEDEQEKCQRYYSDSAEKEFGEYKVKVIEKAVETWNPVKYTVLQVQRKNNPAKHLVHHYWYHDWHDQVAPLDPIPMIRLYKGALKKSNGKPMVVHCSAGVGRTSTFIGIHLAAVMIRENACLEMIEVLKRLRKMRLGSIQSQLQYVFLIVCIIQLFIEEKYIKKDASFESLLKKYADVTRKVTEAIVQEEERKKRKKKEAEKKDKDAPSKGSKKTEEVKEVSKAVKKGEDPLAKDALSKRKADEATMDDKTKDEKRSDHVRKESASPSVMVRETISGKEKSKCQKIESKNDKKKVAKKSKRKPNIFGF